MWGKAIQTDAKISPNNYGGPLIDISGRVLGLLVLIPARTIEQLLAGVEWYDSGIGFAVPLASLQTVLPRLAAGNDLYPGLLGIGMKGGDPIGQAPVIAACRPHSPASEADLHAGDTIVEIDGKPVARQSQFKQELSRHYAGDRVRLARPAAAASSTRSSWPKKSLPMPFPSPASCRCGRWPANPTG